MPRQYEEIGTEVDRLFYSFSHAAVNSIGRLIVGFRVEGAENISQDHAQLIVFNHLNASDVLWGPASIPRRHATVIGREGVMNKKIVGSLFRRWGAKTIHRPATGENNFAALREALEVMKRPLLENRLEIIYGSPNTRTPGFKPSRPISSIANVARITGVDVVPGVIKGSDRIREDRLVVVKFGKPIRHKGGPRNDKELINDIYLSQAESFDSIEHPFEYADPEEEIVLGQDVWL
jgi:1-acyl-sn-glycerol-3-phosphate acyltransferase